MDGCFAGSAHASRNTSAMSHSGVPRLYAKPSPITTRTTPMVVGRGGEEASSVVRVVRVVRVVGAAGLLPSVTWKVPGATALVVKKVPPGPREWTVVAAAKQ